MYREIPPLAHLAPFIECLWISQPDAQIADASEIRVVPDGCIDLIFDMTPNMENAFWVGTMTTSLCLNSTVPRSLLGIRFHPGGARQMIPCPAAELVNQRVPIRDLTPNFSIILESLVMRSDPVKTIYKWLDSQVVPTTTSSLVFEIHRRITCNKTISMLAEEIGYSRQYLNRIMKDTVGVDLKRFSRIVRMRKLILFLTDSRIPVNWSECAVSFGFYDQSHLINEFNDLVGINPGEFLQTLKSI
jgi:AraC-like DNA-binding protein